MKINFEFKKIPIWQWLLAIAVLVSLGASLTVISQLIAVKKNNQAVVIANPTINQVAALGRLEPDSEIIQLNVPLNLDGDRLEKLLVKEGDKVTIGQIIAILDSRQSLQSELRQAQEQLKIAKARLNQVKAGAKIGEINAQKATIEQIKADVNGQIREQQANLARLQAQLLGETASQQATISRLQAELENANTECNRYQKLYQDGVVSSSHYETQCLRPKTIKETLNEALANLNRITTTYQEQIRESQANLERLITAGKKQIDQAEATLTQIEEVRPVDLQIVQAEVDHAIANLAQAEIKFNQVYIKSPINGQILKIQTREGEKISEFGIVELAQTNKMVAIAEVYQTDIEQVKIGQEAIITSPAFSGEIKGIVSQIGLQVTRQNIFSNQPGENLDRRVIEVKISLDPEASKQVSHFTNLQVEILIKLNPNHS